MTLVRDAHGAKAEAGGRDAADGVPIQFTVSGSVFDHPGGGIGLLVKVAAGSLLNFEKKCVGICVLGFAEQARSEEKARERQD